MKITDDTVGRFFQDFQEKVSDKSMSFLDDVGLSPSGRLVKISGYASDSEGEVKAAKDRLYNCLKECFPSQGISQHMKLSEVSKILNNRVIAVARNEEKRIPSHRSVSPSRPPSPSAEELLKQCYADEADVVSEIIDGVNSYLILRDAKKKPRFIFKPSSGESSVDRYGEPLSPGIPEGKFYLREIVPMLFNEENFFPVPETFIWELDSPGSCQEFIPDATPMGRKVIRRESIDFVDKEDLERLAILDLIIGNQDRHLDNILISGNRALGIDHGLSMSSDPNEDIKIETPNIPQYKKEVSEEVIRYCKELYLTKRLDLKSDLLKLGIEEAAVNCCMERIRILFQLLLISDKKGVPISVHELVHWGIFLSRYILENDFETVLLSKINGLLDLKKEINEVLNNGTRTEKIRVKHNAQLPNKKFIQDEMAKRLMISVQEAEKLWSNAFLPVFKE